MCGQVTPITGSHYVSRQPGWPPAAGKLSGWPATSATCPPTARSWPNRRRNSLRSPQSDPSWQRPSSSPWGHIQGGSASKRRSPRSPALPHPRLVRVHSATVSTGAATDGQTRRIKLASLAAPDGQIAARAPNRGQAIHESHAQTSTTPTLPASPPASQQEESRAIHRLLGPVEPL